MDLFRNRDMGAFLDEALSFPEGEIEQEKHFPTQ